jgi:tRNA modification GTPase
VLDVSEFPRSGFAPDRQLLEQTRDRPSIVVCNKSDLLANGHDLITSSLPSNDQAHAVFTSALTGEGITQLQSMIFERVHGNTGEQETGFLTNVRQQVLVADAIAALDRASEAVPLRTPHEMVLLDLYSALRPLDDITGATTAEDILNLIFSSFCIGK